MANSMADMAAQINALRCKFIPHKHYTDIKKRFELLYHMRVDAIKTGVFREARGISVIGASGCGKSTCVRRIIANHDETHAPPKGVLHRDIVSISIPSPATLKTVGHALLSELGYELQRDRPAGFIWKQVRFMLKEQRVLFLYFDEAQDLLKSGTPKETQSVVNMLKSILQAPEWPVNLILSGTAELTKILNHDAQIGRRIPPVAFERLSISRDGDRIESFIAKYAESAGLNPEAHLFERDFLERLIFAADREFGLLIEFILAGIEQSLLNGSSDLSRHSFIEAFREHSGCVGATNPFIAIDFERLNVRLLLQHGEEIGHA